MPQWLFDSDGDPVGFISGKSIYTPKGDFVGRLYEDNTIYNGNYLGELWGDDRVLFDTRKAFDRRGLPGMPTLPGFIGEPPFKGPVTLPPKCRDVDFR